MRIENLEMLRSFSRVPVGQTIDDFTKTMIIKAKAFNDTKKSADNKKNANVQLRVGYQRAYVGRADDTCKITAVDTSRIRDPVIGECTFDHKTGRVSKFMIFPEDYRHVGIGKRMLELCVATLRMHGTATEVWGVTRAIEFKNMTTFKDKIHYRDPVHPNLEALPGYYMKL